VCSRRVGYTFVLNTVCLCIWALHKGWWNRPIHTHAIEQYPKATDQVSISPTYLRTAFTPVAPKSVRIQSSCQYLFTLLGSTGAKAAHRTLMKLTQGVNFINVLCKAFTLLDPKSAKLTVKSLVILRFWDWRKSCS
jgi:hypothetical protein